MDLGESFVLEYSSDGGKSWTLVNRWVVDGTAYRNEKFYPEVVDFNKVSGLYYDLTTQARLRFRCDASDNKDFIYLDEVLFEGLYASPPKCPTYKSSAYKLSTYKCPTYKSSAHN